MKVVETYITDIAYKVTQQRLAELVTRLLNGETLRTGEIIRYAALVAPKYYTPKLREIFKEQELRQQRRQQAHPPSP